MIDATSDIKFVIFTDVFLMYTIKRLVYTKRWQRCHSFYYIAGV